MLELTQNNTASLLNQWGATGVGVGNKLVDGMKTKDKAIRVKVKDKIPFDQLSSDKVIPKEIMYKGKTYLTDVIVRKGQAKALDCCRPNDATQSVVDTAQRTPVRPLVGGLGIGSIDDTPSYVGTLGQLCIDDRDGTVVGLTNVHVSNADVWYNSNKERYYNTYNKRIMQPGRESSVANHYPMSDPRGATSHRESLIDAYGIGIIKRYWPLEPTRSLSFGFGELRSIPFKSEAQHMDGEYNKIDAAIFSINNDDTLIDNTTQEGRSQAFSIRGLSNVAIPWATDEQMETFISLIESSNTTLYVARSGRTTGTVGAGFEFGDCPVEVTEYSLSEGIMYTPQAAWFRDMIVFEYSAGSCSIITPPIHGGDSGSMLVTDFFDNTPVVVGICHAGNARDGIGYACRIDHVRSILNVRSPTLSELSNPLTFTDFSQASFIKASGLPGVIENSGYLEYNGKKYWQIGNAPTQ